MRTLQSLSLALLVGVAMAGVRAPLAAQAERLLSERELEYASALLEYESRRASWDAQRARFQNAVAEVTAAKLSGNSARLENAYQTSAVLSLELDRLSRRVDVALGVLDEEKRDLLAALDLRRRGLEQQLVVARSPEQQSDVRSQIVDLQNQYRSLTDEGGLRPTLVFWPEVDAGPLDGIEELRAKVEILERQVREAVQEMERVDVEIERLRGLQRLERFAADARTSRDRFGDTNVPVGSPGRSGLEAGARATADTIAVPFPDRPLAQQIETMRAYREQLELMRAQLEARATSIRARLPRTLGEDLP